MRANRNPNARGLAAIGIGPGRGGAPRRAAASGEIKMLVAMRADLVRALGEAEFVRLFGPLDYLLVLDTDATETGQMANVVMPIAAYPELEGSFTNFNGRVQRINKAFDPPGEARPAIEVVDALAARLDGDSASAGAGSASAVPLTADTVFAAIAATEPAFAGLTLDGLGEHGAPLKIPTT